MMKMQYSSFLQFQSQSPTIFQKMRFIQEYWNGRNVKLKWYLGKKLKLLWWNFIFLPQTCPGNNGILIQTKTKTKTTTNHSYRILFHTLLLSNSATVQCAPLFYIAVLYQRHSLFFYFLSCLVGCLLHEDLSSKRHLDMHTNLPSRIQPWSQYSALKVS